MIKNIEQLKEIRGEIFGSFRKRHDAIMNLLDALSSYGHRCKSVIELSTAPCFPRQYSSITDAIADGLPSVDWKKIQKTVEKSTSGNQSPKVIKFILDCTPQPRPFSKKLDDRSVVHAPNPAPGNKPICVGHQYSTLVQLPQDPDDSQHHWVIPITVDRVHSHEKGNERGMQQLVDHLSTLKHHGELYISIADSLYLTATCRKYAEQNPHLVHIARINSTRNVFKIAELGNEKNHLVGRKKRFGDKMSLNDPEQLLPHDREEKLPIMTSKNKTATAVIRCWNDRIFRGSKKFRADLRPTNIMQITLIDSEGKPLFKRALWIAVDGERRHEVSLADAYQYYKSRYDIEHFYRFGKQKLLMASYQTPSEEHENNWWKLTSLAYLQLYLARSLTLATPQTWERYLPAYKNKFTSRVTTPSQTQRGFAKLLLEAGTPAASPVARGKPAGRMVGTLRDKRPSMPIVFKGNKLTQPLVEAISPGSEKNDSVSNPKKIASLAQSVRAELNKQKIPVEEFVKMLNDTA